MVRPSASPNVLQAKEMLEQYGDMCDVMYLMMAADGRVLNVACGQRTTLNEILELLRRLLDAEIRPDYRDERPGDVKHSLAAIDRARESIGYEPKLFFEEGLTRSIDWYRANLG